MGSIPCPWCDAALDADAEKCAACGKPPIVCEHFRVTKVLGRGGMGIVYAGVRTGGAHDEVAVKIIAPPTDDDWTAWELFERSTKVLQQLDHASLPKVHAFERTDRGRLVLVREPFDGGTLEERIADSDDRISPERVRTLLDCMLALLVYLQRLVPPVIHRDIKPSNVMFRTKDDWEPVLVDFDTIVSRKSGLTIVGTPGYAAPEQFAADASAASDVYGLGATMLFVGTHTDADAIPHVHGRFVLDGLMPSLDAKLVSVLARMVEPDVSKRYATASDVLADLAKPTPRPEPAKATPKPAPSPHRRSWGWVALPVGLIAAGLVLSKTSHKKEDARGVSPSSTTSMSPLERDQAALNADDDRGCKEGDAGACYDLALRYDDGTGGVTKDYARAATLYDRGCQLGNHDACNNLGVDYEHGYGVAASGTKAVELYGKACDAKDARGCRNLAYLYESDAGVHDFPKALAFFTRGCDLEDGSSCNNLGWMYEDGQGTRVDLKKAAGFYGLACDHGFLYGCRNSGIAYQTADGVERDDRRAYALFKRSCVKEETSGCTELGRMTKTGRGTARDAARASEAFRTGCDDGRLDACDELASLYALGSGVPKDIARARTLYESACDGGIAESCSELKKLVR